MCHKLYHSVFFPPFFVLLPVLKMTRIVGNFEANNGYILANLDGNWLDDTHGWLVYSQKCIAIGYLFRVNHNLPVYRCTPSENSIHPQTQFAGGYNKFPTAKQISNQTRP